MQSRHLPTSQLEAIRYFTDDATCHSFLTEMRWGNSPRCAHCQSSNIGKLVVSTVQSRSKKPDAKPTTRRLWNCKACKKQFTAKTGTIFEDSALGLDKWLIAVWLICNAKNGISSCELSRTLGITQKSAWFVGHRIRVAMREGSLELSGEVESDEAYIGGKIYNMALKKRKTVTNNFQNKTQVIGMLQRSPKRGGSKVVLEAIDGTSTKHLTDHVVERVKHGSKLYTDAASHYSAIKHWFEHEFVDHSIKYVEGKVHTNGLENFWSLLKRTLKGTYVSVSPAHLFRYLDEQACRFNERGGNDLERFVATMKRVSGRRLPYVALTNIGLI